MWMLILMALMKILGEDYGKDNVCDTVSFAERDDSISFLKK